MAQPDRRLFTPPSLRTIEGNLAGVIEVARSRFQKLASQSAVTHRSVIDGWKAYATFDAAISEAKGLVTNPNPNIEEVVKGLEHPEFPIHETTAQLAHESFQSQSRMLLQGLQKDALENALIFCRTMDRVGRVRGDISLLEPITSKPLPQTL